MTREERMKWWHETRFGMFTHWGLYAIPARGEWLMYLERIPKEEYFLLAQQFRPPESFSPEAWVKLAKEAGMKYMVLTTRHHDGFCLFDSQVSDFTSIKTSAGRDFVAEYVRACHKHGMRVGLYYSLLDWRFPGYHTGDPDSVRTMVEQAHSQVRELMTNYGKVDILWYDGNWVPGIRCRNKDEKVYFNAIAKYWNAQKLNAMMRKFQPHILINNRSGTPEDFGTPEQHVTAEEAGRPWEACMTIGDSCGWGYIKNNPNIKTVPQILQYLVQCVCKGGNFLLNIGPKADGSVQKDFADKLKEVGVWMKGNEESVRGTERNDTITCGIIGLATIKRNIVYYHIFRWPGQTARIPGLKNRITRAKILSTGQKVKWNQSSDGIVTFSGLPLNSPDKYDTVIAVQVQGNPQGFDYTGIPL